MSWRIEFAAYVAIEALVGCLPGPWIARLGRLMGGLGHGLATKRRRVVRRNLRIVFSEEKTLAEIDVLTREVFKRAGANLLSALHTSRLDAAGLLAAIEVEGADEFAKVLASGQGTAVILAHMGNWEALAQVFPRLLPGNVKSGTVYRPLNNPLLNARVEAARGSAGLTLFSNRDTPLGMSAFIKSGGALGVLSDQRVGKSGEITPFFGRLTSCTPLLSLFARRSGAAVVGVSVCTIAPGRWRMRLHPMKEAIPDTAACMRLLEAVIRDSPEDVFWMQDRWRTGRVEPLKLEGKLGGSVDVAACKSRRVLVWGELAADQLPPAWPDDVHWEFMRPQADESAKALARRLCAIDESAVMPVECVVAAYADATLVKACRQAGFQLIDAKGQRVA